MTRNHWHTRNVVMVERTRTLRLSEFTKEKGRGGDYKLINLKGLGNLESFRT